MGKLIGILVGRHGEAIQSLRELSRSSIQVGTPLPGGELQTVFVQGDCDLAEQLIFDKLRDRAPHWFVKGPGSKTALINHVTGREAPKGFGQQDREYWLCKCFNMNFIHRTTCNRCFSPKPGASVGIQGVSL